MSIKFNCQADIKRKGFVMKKQLFLAVLIAVLVFWLILAGCPADNISEIPVFKPEPVTYFMPEDPSDTRPDYNIYFLGNSITLHYPQPDLGWFGTWGMAASSKENDYTGQLTHKLRNEFNNYRINYTTHYIRYWEVNFNETVKINTEKPIDLLVVQLGENVDETYARANNYYVALSKLITSVKGENAKVIMLDPFWPSGYKTAIHRKIAEENGYYFVAISDLFSDIDNLAYGTFDNTAVAMHPGDKGMKAIAERLYKCVKDNGIIP
jgi:lysophospholipase L1-like esterase